MKYPVYPKYKESGVAWLGEVPEHWEAKKLGYGAHLQGGYAFASDKFESEGIPVIRMNNLKRGVLDTAEANCLALENCLDAFALGEGDLLWGMSGSIGETGSLGNFARVSARDLPAQLNQRVGRFRIVGDFCSLDFLTYVIQTKLFYDQILLRATGTAQFNVSSEQVQSANVPFPPVSEQTSIADFLDCETGRLDTLVAKKRVLIGLLKEERSALISRTVTRGLPAEVAREFGLKPHTSFKDSGIEWLGEVPEGWEVTRIKEVSSIVGRIGFRGYSTEDLVSEGEGAISMSPSNMANGVVTLLKCTFLSWEKYYESPEIMVEPGDIIMVKTGSTIGKTVMVESVFVPMTINPQLMIFKGVKCSNRFLFFYLSSKIIQDLIPLHNTGSTIPTMTQESIGKLGILAPPLTEQTAIIAFLDRETARIDRLIEKVEAAIERLREYRTSLITAAVTGKIDVREGGS